MTGVRSNWDGMAEQHAAIISVGPWRIDSATGRATSGDRELTLRPRDVGVLLALARHAGEVVSVDELISAAWHGAVVSNDALYFSISQLRKALDDADCANSIIETMPKRGYRLSSDAQITSAISVANTDSADRVATPHAIGARWYLGWNSYSLVTLAIVSVAVVWLLHGRLISGPVPAAQNSIAVMPFIDLSPEADHTYLSDGISEELLSRLARVPGLQVAARTSSFAFKDQVTDVVDIGRSLGVASIIEGSVRKDGNRVRIAVQLIDANTGFQIWSDTYDQQLGSVLVLQNEISRRIIDALEPTLNSGNTGQPLMATLTANPAAIEPYLMGLEQQRINSFTSLQSAAKYFASALIADPSFPQASVELAETNIDLIEIGASFDPALLQEAKSLAYQALAADPGSGEAYRIIAKAEMLSGDSSKSESLLRKALDLSPSNSAAMVDLAQIMAHAGDSAAARTYLQQALRIDPYGDTVLMKLGHLHWSEDRLDQARSSFERGALVHPQNPIFPMSLGLLQVLNLGELAGGLHNFLLAAELDPRDFEIAAYVAMSYLTLGMPDDARPWIDRAVSLGPRAATSLALESSWLAQQGDLAGAVRLSTSVLADPRYIYRGHKLLWEPHYLIGISGLIENGQAANAISLLQRNRVLRANKFFVTADQRAIDVDNDNEDKGSGQIRWLLSLANAQRALGRPAESVSTLELVEDNSADPVKNMRYRGVRKKLVEAEVRALQGERDTVLDLLEKVVEQGPVFNWQVQIGLNNAFADLRDSERFQDLLADMQASTALQRQRLPAMMHMSQTRPAVTHELLLE